MGSWERFLSALGGGALEDGEGFGLGQWACQRSKDEEAPWVSQLDRSLSLSKKACPVVSPKYS